jgi:hypothetical protein
MTQYAWAYIIGGSILLGATASLAGSQSTSPDAGPPRVDLLPREAKASTATATNGDTRCEQCHSTSNWEKATFDHDRTGFSLKGAHAGAGCKECHTVDFSQTLSRNCASCHQDAHRGEFGTQCQGCHTEASWAPLFNAEAHRRTNFPLVGRHAFIPCTECHTAMTNRTFERTTVECVGCHQADYNSTVGTQVNHVQLGFNTQCGTCHTSTTWNGARFTGHDSCFQIVGGHHSQISCLGCHSSLAGVMATGNCSTHTFTCSGCHEHACAKMDSLHASIKLNGSSGVPGYACQDSKCYVCHTIVSSP